MCRYNANVEDGGSCVGSENPRYTTKPSDPWNDRGGKPKVCVYGDSGVDIPKPQPKPKRRSKMCYYSIDGIPTGMDCSGTGPRQKKVREPKARPAPKQRARPEPKTKTRPAAKPTKRTRTKPATVKPERVREDPSVRRAAERQRHEERQTAKRAREQARVAAKRAKQNVHDAKRARQKAAVAQKAQEKKAEQEAAAQMSRDNAKAYRKEQRQRRAQETKLRRQANKIAKRNAKKIAKRVKRTVPPKVKPAATPEASRAPKPTKAARPERVRTPRAPRKPMSLRGFGKAALVLALASLAPQAVAVVLAGAAIVAQIAAVATVVIGVGGASFLALAASYALWAVVRDRQADVKATRYQRNVTEPALSSRVLYRQAPNQGNSTRRFDPAEVITCIGTHELPVALQRQIEANPELVNPFPEGERSQESREVLTAIANALQGKKALYREGEIDNVACELTTPQWALPKSPADLTLQDFMPRRERVLATVGPRVSPVAVEQREQRQLAAQETAQQVYDRFVRENGEL